MELSCLKLAWDEGVGIKAIGYDQGSGYICTYVYGVHILTLLLCLLDGMI